MGIKGLLPLVKKSSRPCKIDEYYGRTVAVDACCWLHRGAFGCADKLVKNEKTDFYIHYCLKYIKMLLSHRIHVILVFDGASLPAKQQTDSERKERRNSMKMKGKRLLAEGKNAEAYDCFRQCTEITFDMACSSLPDVDCIVAPYESDAQLAYLSAKGIAQLIITEDSDLIVFGCTNIMFKMDHGGHGTLYERKNLHLSLGLAEEKLDFVKFRRSCILSGCDYLEGLEGIGLIKAFKFFNMTSKEDLQKVLPKISSYLRMPKLSVDKSFVEKFMEAENTFLYQIVFDVCSKRAAPLNPYSDDFNDSADDLNYAGRIFDDDMAYQLAVGNVNSYTHEAINNFDPKTSTRSIWCSNYNPAQAIFDEEADTKKEVTRQSAFSTTASRIVIKNKSPKKVSATKKDNVAAERIGYESPVEPIPVVSRYFLSNYRNSKLPESKILASVKVSPKCDQRSALETLEEMGEDEGARLSKSVVTSPLSMFETPSIRNVSSASRHQTKSPEKQLQTKFSSTSPIFGRKKRSFDVSPAANVKEARRSLRKFCYVSPRKLFERRPNEDNSQKLHVSEHYSQVSLQSQSTSDTNDSPIVSLCSSSGSVVSSTDSGLERVTSENDDDIDDVIDLTNDSNEINLSGDFIDTKYDRISQISMKNRRNFSQTPPQTSKFIGKCKSLGLGKTSDSTKKFPNLKQTNIKEMFSSFEYKKI